MRQCGKIKYIPKSEPGWIGLDCNLGARTDLPVLTLEYEPNVCDRICNRKDSVIVGHDIKNQTITCDCGISEKIQNYLTWPYKCAFQPYDPEKQKCVNGRIYPGKDERMNLQQSCDTLCCNNEPVCNGNVPDWFERREPLVLKEKCKYDIPKYKMNQY